MAAIDFPGSPTTGQLFAASNGVTYQWNGTLWLVLAGPGGGTGDFSAYNSAVISLPAGTNVVLIPNTVLSGNSGLWYNTTTGRYTPPAGRYSIMCSMTAVPTSAASTMQITLRKNGVGVGGYGSAVSPQAGYQVDLFHNATVDANGTDYFDYIGNSGNIGQAAVTQFTAFPLTGMQGPSGGAPGSVVGDFTAVIINNAIATSPATVIPTTIVSGNSGAYYSTSTGRWTPPAGRYLLFGNCSVFISATGSVIGYLRKNGVNIGGPTYGYVSAAGQSSDVSIQFVVDANGSDFFDFQMQAGVAGATANLTTFGATPTQGMVGPQGPQGPQGPTAGGGIVADTSLAAPALGMNFQSLTTMRTIELSFYMVPTTVGQTLYLRIMNGGTPNVGATAYSTQRHYATTTTPGSDFQNTSGYMLSSGVTASGAFGKVHLLGGSAGNFGSMGVGQVMAYSNTILNLGFSGPSGDGVNFQFGSGNIAAGSYCRVIGWP
jgi:hypothetical protein